MKNINYKFHRIITLIAATCMLSSLLAACNDLPNSDQASEEGVKHKEAIAAAFAQNETMQNHSFQGTLSVDLERFIGKEKLLNSPYSSLFTQGMTWDGIAYRNPEQLEARISMDVLGQGTPSTIPILIMDGQLYFQIPLLNLDNEFFVLPMENISSMKGLSISALLLTQSALNEINKYIFAAIDPKWISSTASQTSSDDQADRLAPVRYEIQITAENADKVESAVLTGIVDWLAQLNEEAIENSTNPDTLPKLEVSDNQIQLQPGSSIAVVVDPQGYIIEQLIELSGENVTSGEPLSAFTYGILIEQVNQSPQITADAPEKVLDFQSVLTFLDNRLREKSKE
jgi:hypothetical protein